MIDDPADGALAGLGLEVLPPRLGRDPENVLGAVFVGVLRIGPFGTLSLKLGVVLLEGVGDLFEENEAEDHVLVLGGIHRAAQGVGCPPQLGLET